MNRKARIVATIGPASRDPAVLEKLITAGMNVARLNFSHGTHDEHADCIRTLRRVAKGLSRSVGILQDLQGPKIRVGELPAPLQLSEGEVVQLYASGTEAPSAGQAASIPVDFRQLFDSVQPGDRLLLDDGRLALQVDTVHENMLAARVVVGGLLTSHKGINLPGARLRIEGFTEKDEADLAFGLAQGVDAVAVSFVRSSADVVKVRSAMERLSAQKQLPLLIAKLEKPEAVDDLDAILSQVDGVMVARGDLGVELPPERVPALQKSIIQAANRRAKLVVTATQMLESMVSNPLPTRAEASDVANAIFDGTDAVMLSAETAAGQHPMEAVRVMARIAVEAEGALAEFAAAASIERASTFPDVISEAACRAASEVRARAIVAFTQSGFTARLLAKYRPEVPVLAFSPSEAVRRRLCFHWGVVPKTIGSIRGSDEMVEVIEALLLQENAVEVGDALVIVAGAPLWKRGATNQIRLHRVEGQG